MKYQIASISLTLLIKVNLLFYPTSMASPSNNKQEDCYPTGRTTFILPGTENIIKISRSKDFALLYHPHSDQFHIFFFKDRRLTGPFRKEPGSFLTITKNGLIARNKPINVASVSAPSLIKDLVAVIVDPHDNMKEKTIAGLFVGDESIFRPVKWIDNQTLLYVGMETNNQRLLSLDHNVDVRMINENTPQVLYHNKNHQLAITNGQRILANISFKEKMVKDATMGIFSHDNRFYVAAVQIRNQPAPTLLIVDLVNEKHRFIDLPSQNQQDVEVLDLNLSQHQFSKNSKYFLLYGGKHAQTPITVLDLETGSMRSLPNVKLTNALFNEFDHICGAERRETSEPQTSGWHWSCWDFEGKKRLYSQKLDHYVIDSRVYLVEGNSLVLENTESTYLESQGKQYFYTTFNTTCPKIVPVTCDCTNIHPGQTLSVPLGNIQNLALTAACAKNFHQKDWEKLTPQKNVDQIDETTALLLLKRFSKPEGFNIEEHTGILIGMIQAGIHRKFPSQFKSALAGVLYQSNQLYNTLINRFPEITKIEEAPDLSCVTEEERSKIRDAAYQFALIQIQDPVSMTYHRLNTMSYLVKDLVPEGQKEELADKIANRMLFLAKMLPVLRELPSSKLYRFAFNKAKQALNVPYHDITDAFVTRPGLDVVRIYKLGLEPFDGAEKTNIGIYVKSAGTVDVSELENEHNKALEKTLTWNYGNREFLSHIKLKSIKPDRPIVKKDPSPDYEKMWKDGHFSGLILFGSSIGEKWVNNTILEYTKYFMRDNHFKFEPKPIPIDNVTQFLQKRLLDKQPIDYFIKEAHSDGDTQNLFRLHNKGYLLRGHRTINGKKETVEIVIPDPNSKTTLISNQDFGQWMRERERLNDSDLIYINASCWSAGDKAKWEISAAGSSNLINIATLGTVFTFVSDDDSAPRYLLDGIRHQRTYAQIREEMKKDPKYHARISNVFLFPDEPEYHELITKYVNRPVDSNVQTFVKKNSKLIPYNIDEPNP
ncbi:MAG: hypothetical protein NZ480_03605 [Bdellovibrionaceae bacterium]|nr:hypothetical protein [Pseudobdellovibrionaceae bacterium]MDW8189479.1 hypothetical protein [Pseudobdellovibrionaceae bacterium]